MRRMPRRVRVPSGSESAQCGSPGLSLDRGGQRSSSLAALASAPFENSARIETHVPIRGIAADDTRLSSAIVFARRRRNKAGEAPRPSCVACIRTTDEATRAILRLFQQGDPVRTLRGWR